MTTTDALLARTVHFVVKPGVCRPAIVTADTPDGLNMQVMPDGANDLDTGYDRPYWVGRIPHTYVGTVGTWHRTYDCPHCSPNPVL